MDGVSEHCEHLSHNMWDAKRHQRSLVVTLLDLQNAFGEIHHDLFKFALERHLLS